MKRSFGTMEEFSKSASELSTPPAFEETSIPEHHYHLGGSNYVAVTYFTNSLLIHLREYVQSDKGDLYPTRKGTTLTPLLWLSFIRKSECLKESVLSGDKIILEDSLFISKVQLDLGTHVSFQRYFTKKDFTRQFQPTACMLSKQEFTKLTSDSVFQKEINSSVIALSYKHVFPHITLKEMKKYPPHSPSTIKELMEAEDILFTTLVDLLKTNIGLNVNLLFKCFGCSQNYKNHLAHECMTYNFEQRLSTCEDMAVLSIDLDSLARNFIEQNVHILNYVNSSFFSKLDGCLLTRSAKKLYIASDPDPLKMF